MQTTVDNGNIRLPGHTDMHAQIRNILDVAWRTGTESEAQVRARIRKRITGLWGSAWLVDVEARFAGDELHAKKHWTPSSEYGERWSESFENEILDEVSQPSEELISSAAPTETKLLVDPGKTFYLLYDPDGTLADDAGLEITYQLAEKGRVTFVIKPVGQPANRVIDQRFHGESPAGYYDRPWNGAVENGGDPLPDDDVVRLHGTGGVLEWAHRHGNGTAARGARRRLRDPVLCG